ncbi:MAG TPA: CHASE3 domain-containing protein [Stellaceae bacterium]|nr:CHASE3 domain-containing protein [Stellaceae bacterium]
MTALDTAEPRLARGSLFRNGSGRSTIGAKLALALTLGPVILAIVGWIAYANTARLIESRDQLQVSYAVITQSRELLKLLVDAETGQRGFVITGDERYLEPYRTATAELSSTLARFAELVGADPAQRTRVRDLEDLSKLKLQELATTIDARRSGGFDAALALIKSGAGKERMDRVRKLMGEIEGAEQDRLTQRSVEISHLSEMTYDSIIYGTAGSVLVLALAGFFVGRAINVPVRTAVAALTTAAVEILAATSEQVAATAEEATAVRQTGVTVTQVRQTAELATQKATAVVDTADKAVRVAQDGRRAVDDSIASSEEAKSRMEGLAERILALSEQAHAIAEINAAVNDLAEQSNLLAVNASIEAAKAGEAGKGFAVVAGEVRGLAEQSKQATAQVRGILGEIQRATQAAVLAAEQGVKSAEGGVATADRTAEAIRALAETVAETGQAAQQILAASQQQTVGMDQVALATRNIEQSSTQTVAATRQVQNAAKDLNALAGRLAQLVGGAAPNHAVAS